MAPQSPSTPSLKGPPRRYPQGTPREELDKSCWAWVDEVEDPERGLISEHQVGLAYRLHYPTHFYPEQACKRNCKFNPRCYCGELATGLSLRLNVGFFFQPYYFTSQAWG